MLFPLKGSIGCFGYCALQRNKINMDSTRINNNLDETTSISYKKDVNG